MKQWIGPILGTLAAMIVQSLDAAGAADRMEPLGLRDVKVGGEIGRRIAVTITNNLLVLDLDRDFLRAFSEDPRSGNFIGLGMLLDSAVKLAAYTGDPAAVAAKQRLVDGVLRAQEADGYIGTFPPAQRVVKIWDVHEMGYVILGLLENHRQFEDAASLAAARRAADWLVKNWSRLPPDWGRGADVAPHVAFTGIERTMLSLHRATGEPAYLDFVAKTRALPEWDLGIVVGRRQGIEGHMYAYLARCLAQLELNRAQPDADLLRATDRAMEFLQRRDGMLITGSAGQYEIWTGDQDARRDVGETCALAYQVRVWESLLRLRGDARMGDLMERTIFNALFASQSPDGRRLRYFAPLEGPRAYWNTDTYCCPCNYRRIVAELPSMVFYRAGDGLAVNLYTPAQATLAPCGGTRVAVRMETDYPRSGRVRLALDPEVPAAFPVRCRIPAWAVGATVAVNGEAAPGAVAPGTFFELRREWKPGDRIDLDFPMKWRLVKGRQRQAGRVAVMRGPQVFCLNPAQNPDLAAQDGADLGYLTLDPSSLTDPASSGAVRPGGVGCRVRAWRPGFSISPKTDYDLVLTEFADPDGKATYFRLRDYGCAVDDELLAGRALDTPVPRNRDGRPRR